MIRKFLLLLIPLSLGAYQGSIEGAGFSKPWFTGPILGGSGNTVLAGHVNVEPYVFGFARTSFYDSDWKSQSIETLWNIHFRTPVWIGLTDWIDLRITPIWNWNERGGKTAWTMGDWAAQLNFQLYRDQLPHKHWPPSIKISIRETFPTGKYQNLNPKMLGIDGDGTGAWYTSFILSMSKVFAFQKNHFLGLYLNTFYSIPTRVHVKGFNSYGGGVGTNGVVNPEKILSAIFSFEYSLTQNWVIACDFQGIWNSKISFKGTPGVVPSNDGNLDPFALPASNERKAGIQYTIAPAIEYNWSENLGVIAGVWLSVAGKNSSHFTSGVVALNYYR